MSDLVKRAREAERSLAIGRVGDQMAARLISRLADEIERLQQQLGECQGGFDTGTKLIEHQRALLVETSAYLDSLWKAYCVVVSNGGGAMSRHVEPLLPKARVLSAKLDKEQPQNLERPGHTKRGSHEGPNDLQA